VKGVKVFMRGLRAVMMFVYLFTPLADACGRAGAGGIWETAGRGLYAACAEISFEGAHTGRILGSGVEGK